MRKARNPPHDGSAVAPGREVRGKWRVAAASVVRVCAVVRVAAQALGGPDASASAGRQHRKLLQIIPGPPGSERNDRPQAVVPEDQQQEPDRQKPRSKRTKGRRPPSKKARKAPVNHVKRIGPVKRQDTFDGVSPRMVTFIR